MLADIDIEKLKYPVGKFVPTASFNAEEVKKHIHALEILPVYLAETVKGLSAEQLLYKYRPEGWNIKQIVHHVADSHLNFHTRLRLTLTEETPTVKPYDENTWAKLPDSNNDNLEPSLLIIKGVHTRAIELLSTLKEKDYQREYFHPEYNKKFNLLWLLGLYAWHGNHHTEQIKVALQHKF
ncbi:MAG: YfiT family bacillithiol transferase [Bacteroidia bacterium]